MNAEFFTAVFFTGRKRTGSYCAQLCTYCRADEPGASILTFQGRHFRTVKEITGLPDDETATRIAKTLKP